MKLIIIGFMASGKSTMAKILSQKWQLPSHDLDQMVQQNAGMSIPEYFKKYDEAHFRALETDTLGMALKQTGILSTGGGTPMREVNFDAIQNQSAPVVFLNASDQTIQQRLIHDGASSRPLFQKLGMDGMMQLKHRRQLTYERLADRIINVNNENPVFNADRLVDKLGMVTNG
ncbi:shikimate kinase [Acetilactobacillus jinshanensis]|uniref:Shikimate kinase n=1 Tax=Acetilactobacillus jinshanensis TaxID=1720083 RepID=A0A4P6ZM58_9LACO|nr:shikimate kinase [Acetilactobacillus jinshanensis]QBP18320.1 shikimate kinase [Acetilactobacillus jinshanensis]URL61185.1 shikimate kinase [uncultured bacterium]